MFEHTCHCIWFYWLSDFNWKVKMVKMLLKWNKKWLWNKRKEKLKIRGFKKNGKIYFRKLTKIAHLYLRWKVYWKHTWIRLEFVLDLKTRIRKEFEFEKLLFFIFQPNSRNLPALFLPPLLGLGPLLAAQQPTSLPPARGPSRATLLALARYFLPAHAPHTDRRHHAAQLVAWPAWPAPLGTAP